MADTREPSRRARLHRETNGCCIYCGRPVSLDQMEVEHIVPKAKGGADALTNVVCSCSQCNAAKKDMTLEEYLESLTTRKRSALVNRMDALVKHGKLPAAKRDLILGMVPGTPKRRSFAFRWFGKLINIEITIRKK